MGIIIRQSLKGTIVNYIGAFIGFLTTFFILTKFLTAEEIGLTRLLLDAATVFSGIALLGTTSSTIRFYPYFKENETNDHGFFFWTLIVPLVGFLLFLILFYCLKEPIIHFFSENSELFLQYYPYIIPLVFFMIYMWAFETNSNVLMRIAVPKFIREVAIRVLLIAVYMLYAFRVVSLDGFILLFVCVYGIAAVLNVIYFLSLKKITWKPNLKFLTKPLVKDFLFYTLFLLLSALSGTIASKIDVFMVSSKLGLTSTGIYSIAFYIAVIVEIPYRSLSAISLPEISKSMKEKNISRANELVKSVSIHQFLVGCFIFFIIWINIDLIFAILPNGELYSSGKWVVFFIGISRLIDSSFNINYQVLGFSKYYYYSLFFICLLSALAIIGNWLLIEPLGINGAALGTLSAYFVYTILLWFLVKKKVNISPFSSGTLKVAGIVVVMLGINWLWTIFLSPLFSYLPIADIFSSIIDGVVKTLFILGLGIGLVYFLKISDDVNRLTQNILSKVNSIFKNKKS